MLNMVCDLRLFMAWPSLCKKPFFFCYCGVLWRQNWLLYWWRRAKTHNVEPDIATERLQYWLSRSSVKPTAHDAVDGEGTFATQYWLFYHPSCHPIRYRGTLKIKLVILLPMLCG